MLKIEPKTGLKMTPSQDRVVFVMSLGKVVKQIADQLHLSVHTVQTHIKNVKKSNGLHTNTELVKEYILSNPHKFFKTLCVALFITIQGFITFGDMDIDLRRPNRAQRSSKVRRKDNTI